jgi:folylpolyglutamate synthase/dihydropteroate synthase
MDGAHNEQKMAAFVEAFQAFYPDSKAVIMLALKEGKEYKEVVDLIAPITELLILTTFKITQDLPIKSQSPRVIARYAEQNNLKVTVINDSRRAFSKLVNNSNKLKIITGSLYLLGHVRSFKEKIRL